MRPYKNYTAKGSFLILLDLTAFGHYTVISDILRGGADLEQKSYDGDERRSGFLGSGAAFDAAGI